MLGASQDGLKARKNRARAGGLGEGMLEGGRAESPQEGPTERGGILAAVQAAPLFDADHPQASGLGSVLTTFQAVNEWRPSH